jgi:hypothetical protein
MADFLLPWDEDDALKRILRHHHVEVTRPMVEDLSRLINWVRDTESTKAQFKPRQEVPPLMTILSRCGIYGREYIDKVPVAEKP